MAGGHSPHTRDYKTAPPHPLVKAICWLMLAAAIGFLVFSYGDAADRDAKRSQLPQAIHQVT